MSTDCTFYDPTTGEITAVMELSQETLQHYAESDASFLVLVAGNKETQYVVDGVLVDFTPEELAAKRALAPGWVWQMPERVAVDARSMVQARATKAEAISEICAAAILSGFTSSALGTEHHYPAKLTDQTNLAGSILASLLPGNPEAWTTPFWCADAAGEWQFREHTAAEIQQVGRDGKAAILAAMSCNQALAAQIAAATNNADVDAIVWSAP